MDIAQAKICFRYIVQRKVELRDSQDPVVLALDSHLLWASERIGFKRQLKFTEFFFCVGTDLCISQSLPYSTLITHTS